MKQELIEKLRTQLEKLEDPEWELQSFKVWHVPDEIKKLDGTVVERHGWSWGYCQSETCNHNSHDPYMEGHIIHLPASHIGEDMGLVGQGPEPAELYLTPSGAIIRYVYRSPELHFAPRISLELLD